MINNKILFSVLLGLIISSAVYATDPQNPSVGARPLALGKAFCGLADDASAIYFNPAGLPKIKRLQLMNMYASPFPNNSIMTLSGALPSFYGMSAGFSYTNNSTSGIVMTVPDTVEVTYTEQEFLFTFAGWGLENISTAMTINILTRGFSVDSPQLIGNRGAGFDLDLAAHYQASDQLSIGVMAQNALPAFLGGKFYYDSGAFDDMPSNLKLGSALKLRPNLLLLLDFDKALTRTLPLLMHLGLEYQLNEFLALRGGIDQTPTAQNYATDAYTHLTFGLGLKYRGVTFDYTFYKRGDPSGKITNYFSLGYVGEEPKPVSTIEAQKVIPISELLPPRIPVTHFRDVTESNPYKEAIELMATAGFIPGYPDGTFHPDEKITRDFMENVLSSVKRITADKIEEPDKKVTRAELAEAMVELDRVTVDQKLTISSFRDVPASHWAIPYIEAAVRQGIVLPEGYFRPDEAASRADLAQMLAGTAIGRATVKRLH